ncbi:MAG: hypothetical protein KAH44_13565 [Oricola sp.]|nr:hypothetical protein [Oricola sp.]
MQLPRRFYREARFFLNRKNILTPPDEPVFDAETNAFFNERIRSTKVYLEYGAGGATLIAASHAELVVSVESDSHYRELVRGMVSERDCKAEVNVLHGAIGPTGPWGAPLFRVGNTALSGSNYVLAPWRALARCNRKADFVLIDGRYRVACLLTGILDPLGAEACYLFDDFRGRDYYHPVLAFTEIVERAGRSVVLRRKNELDEAACQALRSKSMHDWR